MFFFQFEIIINFLVSSFRFFEYLCYGSTVITNILILTMWGSPLDVITMIFKSWKLSLRRLRLENQSVAAIAR